MPSMVFEFHANSAIRSGSKCFAGRHGEADTVGHEPSGLIGDAQHAVHLMGRDAFLGGAKQVGCRDPLRQRDMAALEHGSDRDRERLAAGTAFIDAGACGLALKLGDGLDLATVRAIRTLGPAKCLKVLTGFVVV